MVATQQQAWLRCVQGSHTPGCCWEAASQYHLGVWEASLLDQLPVLWAATHWSAVAWEMGQTQWT